MTLEQELQQLAEEGKKVKPFVPPQSVAEEQAKQSDETRQSLMTKAHQVHTAIVIEHQSTAAMMRSFADHLRTKADYLDSLANDIEEKSQLAAKATSEALTYERKAYAEYYSISKALEEQSYGQHG